MNFDWFDNNDTVKVTRTADGTAKVIDYPITEFKRMFLSTNDDNCYWTKKFVPATSMQLGVMQSSDPASFAIFKADATRTSDYSGVVGIKLTGNTDSIWQNCFFNIQLPNSYKEGSSLTPTAHIYLDNPTATQKLLLELETSWFNSVVAAPLINTFNYTLTSSSPYMASIGMTALDLTTAEIGSLVCCRFSRINKKTGEGAWSYPDLTGKSDDTAVTDAYLLGITFDIKCDTLGANSQTDKTTGYPRTTLLS